MGSSGITVPSVFLLNYGFLINSGRDRVVVFGSIPTDESHEASENSPGKTQYGTKQNTNSCIRGRESGVEKGMRFQEVKA